MAARQTEVRGGSFLRSFHRRTVSPWNDHRKMAAGQEAHAMQDGSDRLSFGRARRPVEWPRIAKKNGLLFRRRSMNERLRACRIMGRRYPDGLSYSSDREAVSALPTLLLTSVLADPAERRDVSSRKPSANAASLSWSVAVCLNRLLCLIIVYLSNTSTLTQAFLSPH